MSEKIGLVDLVLKSGDYTMPDDCDGWGVRTVRPDLHSSRGFRWPWPGNWAEAPGPINEGNIGACPFDRGDGICLGTTWRGMGSAALPAHTLLLCAYRTADMLSAAGRTERTGKMRLRRAFVVDVIDAAELLRQHGANTDLHSASLTGLDLCQADLDGADLYRADLYRADLDGASLHRADLTEANLPGVSLRGANLRGANLRNANLHRADLTGADLHGADLTGTTLAVARMPAGWSA